MQDAKAKFGGKFERTSKLSKALEFRNGKSSRTPTKIILCLDQGISQHIAFIKQSISAVVHPMQSPSRLPDVAAIRPTNPVHPNPTGLSPPCDHPLSTPRCSRDIRRIFRILNMPAEWCRFFMDSQKQVFCLLSVAAHLLFAMELDPASRRAELSVFPLSEKCFSAGFTDAS